LDNSRNAEAIARRILLLAGFTFALATDILIFAYCASYKYRCSDDRSLPIIGLTSIILLVLNAATNREELRTTLGKLTIALSGVILGYIILIFGMLFSVGFDFGG
jgi:hypothetical protein